MDGQILHVVLVTWAPSAPADLGERLDQAVRVALDGVPGLLEASHGPSVSTEGLEQGYTYGLCLRFADADALAGYLPHPAHRPLSDLIRTHADALLVFDLSTGAPGSTVAP
jgi:hypothetical protein